MKIIHVLKKIDEIDNDIKELRKLEKTLQRDRSFSTPIYMSIEKQVNILLGERIKLLELRIANPPDYLVREFEEEDEPIATPQLNAPVNDKPRDKKEKPSRTVAAKKKEKEKPKAAKAAPKRLTSVFDDEEDDFDDSEPIRMLTQDEIDARLAGASKSAAKPAAKPREEIGVIKLDEDDSLDEIVVPENSRMTASDDDDTDSNDPGIKLLDIALQKGTLNREEIVTEKKRVRFFRDNFPDQ